MKRVSSQAAAPLPEFTSDRMRLLGPLVTPRSLEIARHRLLNHGAKDRVSTMPDDAGTLRVALIILREMNPVIDLTNEEEGILRGMNAETFGKHKARGEV